MKKGYICKCTKCGFKTKEKNELCPICNATMDIIEGQTDNLNPTLPNRLDNSLSSDTKRDIELGYYCYKCRSKKKTKVCIDCNYVNHLYIEYNNKRAVINRTKRLSDIYNEEELDVISKQLTEQEKVYIYHNYEEAHRFFYKKDTPKAIACFVFALIFYFVLLDMTFNMNESEFVFMSYLFNAMGNWLFLVLSIIGVWYLFDATNVEFKKVPASVGIIVGIPNVIQFGYALASNVNMKTTLITGFIAMFVSLITYIIYLIMVKQYEK